MTGPVPSVAWAVVDEELWTAEAVDEELVSLQIRFSPILEDAAASGG